MKALLKIFVVTLIFCAAEHSKAFNALYITPEMVASDFGVKLGSYTVVKHHLATESSKDYAAISVGEELQLIDLNNDNKKKLEEWNDILNKRSSIQIIVNQIEGDSNKIGYASSIPLEKEQTILLAELTEIYLNKDQLSLSDAIQKMNVILEQKLRTKTRCWKSLIYQYEFLKAHILLSAPEAQGEFKSYSCESPQS